MNNGDDQTPAGGRGPDYVPDVPHIPHVPRFARGIVWSDLVREMEAEHAVRLARAAGANVVPLRRGVTPAAPPAEEAA